MPFSKINLNVVLCGEKRKMLRRINTAGGADASIPYIIDYSMELMSVYKHQDQNYFHILTVTVILKLECVPHNVPLESFILCVAWMAMDVVNDDGAPLLFSRVSLHSIPTSVVILVSAVNLNDNRLENKIGCRFKTFS